MGPSPFPDLEQIQIQPNGIKSLLSALNPHKATGPDNISGRFLKELHQELTPALTLIFPGLTTPGPSANNLERCIYHTTVQEGRS